MPSIKQVIAGATVALIGLSLAPAGEAAAATKTVAVAQNSPSSKGLLAPTAKCQIKGNISNTGEKIYHVPGGRYYKATVITPKRGERWFCTESDAKKAGWRKSKI